MSYELYFDGASRGNPGISSSGFVIYKNGDEIVRGGSFLGITTNNRAEYQGLIDGLTECIELKIKEVDVFGDSLLIIKHMRGEFKPDKLKSLFDIADGLSLNFKKITFNHIPRSLNTEADSIANQIIDDAC